MEYDRLDGCSFAENKCNRRAWFPPSVFARVVAFDKYDNNKLVPACTTLLC